MKGILMKPDMLQAYREGRKTVTRRVIKFKPFPNIIDSDWHAPWLDNVSNEWVFTARFGLAARSQRVKPRYQVGETVYIKEAWFPNPATRRPLYKSDYPNEERPQVWGSMATWKTPLFMPAWAARYFIKITDVRAEVFKLPLPPDELEREGGEPALIMLEKINGLWVFRYEFRQVDFKAV